MSVLIKGMEMPTSCSSCPMLEGDRDDGLCRAASRWLDDDEFWTWNVYPEDDADLSRPHNCPLVELPPHGRLIDADALMERKGDCYDSQGHLLYGVGTGTILRMPTIIPAEEGE